MWKSVLLLILGLSAISFVGVKIAEEKAHNVALDKSIAAQEARSALIRQENDGLRQSLEYLSSEDAGTLRAMQKGYQDEDHSVMVVKNVAKVEESLGPLVPEDGREVVLAEDSRQQWHVWFDIFFN